MIVRPAGPDWLLITQPDHAALAADIVAAWQADGLPSRPTRALVLEATREHDNGWIEPDEAPTVDPATGRPHDFITAPDPVKQAVWPRALVRIGADRPAAAALIAQHALTVYRRHREDAAWQPFLAEVERTRDALRRRAGVPVPPGIGRRLTASARGGSRLPPPDLPAAERTFLLDYRALFFGDLLSLVFCNGWTDRLTEGGYALSLRDDRLSVGPDPFGGARVDLRVRAHRIPARRYASDAELRAALDAAPVLWLSGEALGAGAPIAD